MYGPLKPGRKWFKEIVSYLVFFVLGRAFQSAAKWDGVIAEEISQWEDGFVLAMSILPNGPSMAMKKGKKGLVYLGRAPLDPDLSICFKNIESAFLVLTPQMGAVRAFAENRLSLFGDLALSMSFVRCLDRLLVYLYPAFISRSLVKRMPSVPYPVFRRFYLYLIALPFGL